MRAFSPRVLLSIGILAQALIRLAAGEDEDIAAVACFDIGEFAAHYPAGRRVVSRLGAKEIIMPLMDHENPELRRHALLCVSKLMVHNWEAVHQNGK
mmetsp:Transcript_18714/g.43440  ORF Transcript_18714/g.43440 Transcript_18714/m.43440 type:complete len:97 (-) Transcript_18714:130-420(-)